MPYIRMIDVAESQGALRDVYQMMMSRPLPPVYRAPHGGAAGIVRAHRLDPDLMRVSFMATGTMHPGDAVSWAERELIAASASRTNQCVY